ncbi:hypothetical protein SKAU_G00229310 [Synaphobranchus kaupii]|uniref:Uncharacterized protein n=1 Tax=Synaphobranchus kaupii TaxID=118154 RepID=A0A9Q1F5F6_SYNKA|nr:hypothetical protein SKAU_G00229310 [Synaphobranchus kaupii]
MRGTRDSIDRKSNAVQRVRCRNETQQRGFWRYLLQEYETDKVKQPTVIELCELEVVRYYRGARHAERDAVRGHACLNWHQAHKPGVPVKAPRSGGGVPPGRAGAGMLVTSPPVGRRCGNSSPRQLFHRCLL